MFILIHGNNTLEQEEAVTSLLQEHTSQDFGGVNTERLGRPLRFAELQQVCDTLPFLGEQRIVIVKNALGKGAERVVQQVVEYLPHLPPTTLLIFVESRTLSRGHPLLKLARKGNTNKVLHFVLPKPWKLSAWVGERAKKRGIQIQPGAIRLLAQNIGPQPHQLDQELQKLQLYRGDDGPITEEDVRALVPYLQVVDVIFQMVDALGRRNPPAALRYLHRLIVPGTSQYELLRIFGMMVRQFRLLIQTRWLVEHGQTEAQIAERLHLHPYVAKKVRAQAPHFTLEQLRQAYHLLAETDLAIKTGKLEAGAALDLLVVQLTRL